MFERTHDADLHDSTDQGALVGVSDVYDLVALGAAGHATRSGFADPLDEDFLRRADERAELFVLKFFGEREESGQPSPLRFFDYVIAELLGWRVGSPRVLEAEKTGEPDALDQLERLLEILLGLAGKADDDVGAERQTWASRHEEVRSLDVLLFGVAADHSLEHAVASRLHRQVHVTREHVEIAVGRDERRGHVPGMRARVTQPRKFRHGPGDASQERGKFALVDVVAVGKDRG